MLNYYLLEMREIMKVLGTKFDSNLQENPTTSQNSVIWAWIYKIWNVKSNFLKTCIFCTSAITECQRICKNRFFQILDPNIPKPTWDPENLFLWIWSSSGGLLLEVIHYFWNIIHHGIIGPKVGTKTLTEVVLGNYLSC